jgi:hypothetical protein
LDSYCGELERVGAAIKDRVVVRYVNDFGEDESGIT